MTEHDQGTYMSIYEKLRVQPKQKLLTIIRTFTFNFVTKEYYIKQNAAPESRYTLILVPWKPINLIVPALLASVVFTAWLLLLLLALLLHQSSNVCCMSRERMR